MTSPLTKTADRVLSIAPPPARSLPNGRAAVRLLAAAAVLTAAGLYGPRLIAAAGGAPHGPDLDLFLAQPMVIQIHILAAVAAVALGGLILSLRKGHTLHRRMGWMWAGLMAATAGTSLFIVGLNGDVWSLIHLLSGWTLATLPLAVWAARRRRVDLHKRVMTGLFWGASVAAGTFAFLPGRLMWRLFMG
ncbi:MAG: DUF2306 domain-containing protein [Caulobacter sp.]|nr:DUF2306 domain-containing protein [Caulobacter sp.]